MASPFVIDKPINRISFETYVEKVLRPELRPGDFVVMSNLSSHKGLRVREMAESAGERLEYLPPYSPDFNPIENAVSKLKALLCKPLSTPSMPSGTPSAGNSPSSRQRMPELFRRRRI